MSSELYSTLSQEIDQRDWSKGQSEMDLLSEIYEGRLPDSLSHFFPKGHPKHLVNLIRLAWNDLATQVGRVPEFRSDPKNDTALELKRAGLHEKIAHAYLRSASPSAPSFMWELAWSLIGYGRAIAIVLPNHETKMPELTLKDPRHAYPRAKKQSGNRILELADVIFKYEIPTATAEGMGLQVKESRDKFGNVTRPEKTTVIEFVDDTQWLIVSDGGSVIREEHNLGVVPAHVFQSFSPNQEWGLSLFKDQVSFMVAISRLMSQKLAFADQLVNPMIWVKGHEGKIKVGPQVLNRLSSQGAMGVIAPPQNLQVDQDIQVLERFSRILSRNPELRTGEVQNKGSYTSAKTLEQLSEAIDSVVGQYWDIIGTGMAQLIKVCYIMDEKLWSDEQKSISGDIKGKRFLDGYVPSRDINNRHFIRVDYGFGIGGYQGFLMHLQAKDAGVMPRRHAVEAMPGISDVDEALRLIELENMDDAGMANFANMAAQGQLDSVLWAKLRKEMAENRVPLAEVILKYEREIREAAAEAAPSPDVQGAAPAAQGPAPQEAPQPAGIAPGLLA